jgi:membrane protein YdbS with pleckstrin-like domain
MGAMPDDTAPDLFSPPQVQWHPVEPRLAKVRLISHAIGSVPVLAIGVVMCLLVPQIWMFALVAVVVAILAWTAALIPRRVRAMAYAVRDRDLFQRSGIQWRHLSVVPYVRIQMVDIRVGPLERAFGLASLTISTASPTLSAHLHGITPDTAASLRDVLTDRAKLTGLPPGVSAEPVPTVPPAPATGDTAVPAPPPPAWGAQPPTPPPPPAWGAPPPTPPSPPAWDPPPPTPPPPPAWGTPNPTPPTGTAWGTPAPGPADQPPGWAPPPPTPGSWGIPVPPPTPDTRP